MRYFLLVAVAIAYVAYVSTESCVQCNSANDPKCATNPDSYMAKQCNNSSSICYTRVQDGQTIRGCAAELDNSTASRCNNEMECLICSFMEGCNRNVFPTHRPRCIQCSGSNSSTCATDSFATSSVCPLYKLGDKCYIRQTGKNDTNAFSRGCLSSAQAQKLCVDTSNCYTCEGAGCNYLALNDTQIPLARDSASIVGFSLTMLLAVVAAARFF